MTPQLTNPAPGASGPALTPQTFTLTFSDILGAADVSSFQVSFGGTGATAGICSLSYSGGVLGLWDNSANQLLQTPPLQNSQCSVDSYQVTGAGNILTLTVAITFLTSFQGAQEVYALAVSSSGDYHPWVDLGAWTVLAPTMQTRIFPPGTTTWTAPAGVTSIQVEAWGSGGNGANASLHSGNYKSGGGGGGGAYAKKTSVAVSPGQSYAVAVGAAGSTTRTTFGTVVVADYGGNGAEATSLYTPAIGGPGGQASNSIGDITQSGSSGGNGQAPNGGAGGDGANGGPGGLGPFSGNGYPGSAPGGGGAGGSAGSAYTGGAGGGGQLVLTYAGPSVTTYSITGRVTASGVGLAGVNIALSGSSVATATTDANGYYGPFNLTAGGSYTVTASKNGYALSAPQVFSNLAANQTANFTATLATTYSITGYVTVSGSGLSGVTITVTGSQSGSYATDGNGYYSILGLTPGGNYTITPSKSGYTFSPQQQPFTNLAANQTAGFAASGSTVPVVITSAPAGLTLNLDGQPCTSPCSFHWGPGSAHAISAPTQSGGSGTQYVLAPGTITVPSTPLNYTAVFTTQYQVTTSVAPSASAGAVVGAGWYSAGSSAVLTATANGGYQFTGFSGNVSGGTPLTIPINGPVNATADFSAAAIVVTGTSPASAPVGAHVIVSGSNFGPTPGSVTFGTVAATTIVSWTADTVEVVVPAQASTGRVSVFANGFSGTSTTDFAVEPPLAGPTITELSLTSGPKRVGFVIKGSGFGANLGTARIGQTPLTIVANTWSDTQITVQVPDVAASGPVTVTTSGNVGSNSIAFTVTASFGCAAN